MSDLEELDRRVRAPRICAAESRGLRHRLDFDVQQFDHHLSAGRPRAYRRVRGHRDGSGHHTQHRVFPVPARRPADCLQRRRRAVRVSCRVVAQLRADSRRSHGGHHRVVRPLLVIRARKSCLGTQGRCLLQAQV